MRQSHGRVRQVLFTALTAGGLLIGSLPVGADDNLVVSQRFSVATNLGLYGGQPEDIAPDPLSDAVYFASYSPNGIFSSTDLGETWTGLPTDTNYGIGKAVEVDPDTGTVYAMVGDSVLKSEDQGVTWEDITSGLDNPVLGQVMLLAQDRLVVARIDSQVAVSEDRGTSFINYTIEDGSIISDLKAATNSDVYYAITSANEMDTFHLSSDGGETWTDIDVYSAGIPSGNRFYEIGVDPLNDDHLILISHRIVDGVYQTFDGGASWTEVTDQNGDGVHGTHVTFDDTGRVYIGSMYTLDAAASPMTWTGITVETPASSVYADTFGIEPEDANVLYTNTSYGVARSDDQGVSWSDVVDGVTAVKVYDVSQATNKDIVWIGANGGLAKTENFTDSSPTWEYPVLPTTGISNIKAVWVKPLNSDRVVMGGSAVIYYSTDGGTTWSQSTTPTFLGAVQDIVQSPINRNRLFAIYFNNDLSVDDVGGVFMSDDNGQTWSDLGLTDDLPAVSLTVSADETVYVGIGGDASTTGIYSYDGSSWSSLSNSPQTAQISSLLADPDDATILFATTQKDSSSGALFTSTDAGATWSRITTGLTNIINLDTLTMQPSRSTMYVAGQNENSLNGVVYKSTDGGASWSHYYTGLRQETFYTMLFDGLLVGNDQGLFSLQSKASLKLSLSDESVQAGASVGVSGVLKDKATGKKLSDRKVKIYAKVGSGEWKLMGTKTTNARGRVNIDVTPTHNTRYKLRWVPTGEDADEYVNVTSSTERVTID